LIMTARRRALIDKPRARKPYDPASARRRASFAVDAPATFRRVSPSRGPRPPSTILSELRPRACEATQPRSGRPVHDQGDDQRNPTGGREGAALRHASQPAVTVAHVTAALRPFTSQQVGPAGEAVPIDGPNQPIVAGGMTAARSGSPVFTATGANRGGPRGAVHRKAPASPRWPSIPSHQSCSAASLFAADGLRRRTPGRPALRSVRTAPYNGFVREAVRRPAPTCLVSRRTRLSTPAWVGGIRPRTAPRIIVLEHRAHPSVTYLRLPAGFRGGPEPVRDRFDTPTASAENGQGQPGGERRIRSGWWNFQNVKALFPKWPVPRRAEPVIHDTRSPPRRRALAKVQRSASMRAPPALTDDASSTRLRHGLTGLLREQQRLR